MILFNRNQLAITGMSLITSSYDKNFSKIYSIYKKYFQFDFFFSDLKGEKKTNPLLLDFVTLKIETGFVELKFMLKVGMTVVELEIRSKHWIFLVRLFPHRWSNTGTVPTKIIANPGAEVNALARDIIELFTRLYNINSDVRINLTNYRPCIYFYVGTHVCT